jgi:hypothetical protein
MTSIGIAAGAAFGAPFIAPLGWVVQFLDPGQGCNNQPNILQIGAATQDGQGTNNTDWDTVDACNGTCGYLANLYSEPLYEGGASTGIYTDNTVQLAPDSGVTYNGQPLWLAQVFQNNGGCGVGDANNSNVSGCTSENEIALEWSTSAPCPWTGTPSLNGNTYGGAVCYQPAPASPAVDGCGTNNTSCAAYSG